MNKEIEAAIKSSIGSHPAFPFYISTPQPNIGEPMLEYYSGITIRDYFAAQAIIGYISTWNESAVQPITVARIGYAIADAMLKERETK